MIGVCVSTPQTENGYIQIATELFEAECRVKMSGSEWRIYKFIQRKTYGWKKKMDQIAFSQFADGTGLDRRRVIEAVHSLQKRNMIIVRKNGLREPNSYGIQKTYGKWGVVRKNALVTKNGKTSAEKRQKVVRKTAPTIDTKQKKNKRKEIMVPTWIPGSLWESYKKNRIEIKHPMTEEAEKRSIIKLTKLKDGGYDIEAIIERSIERNYRGLFPNDGDKMSEPKYQEEDV